MKYFTGNFTESDADAYAHGCNAQGVMGSGAALAVKNKWPNVFKDYKSILNTYKKNNYTPKELVGMIIVARTPENKPVLNIITQEKYGSDGKKYAQYQSLPIAFNFLADQSMNIKTIAIPRIGAGTGGLKWEFVVELLKEIEETYGFEFWVYTPSSTFYGVQS